ncbi:phosphopantetheine-binding protein [Saccharothrix lopnurensis]|uniref:Phosphopantetheine-binding protein n=1 Tax=Saccharothrix lopnurensis TaxID=1670621 RepID=A0ABW1PAW0_9PSEU
MNGFPGHHRRHDGADPVDALAERLMTGGGVEAALSSVAAPEHRAAVLAALSARYLLAPGVVTASVVGAGRAVRAQLDAVARHVPGTSHVAVRLLDGEPLDRDLVDRLRRTGIGLSVTATAGEAVFGATLVVVTDFADPDTWPTHLPGGSVLVNATGDDLPPAVTRVADLVFVDDLGLLRPGGRPVEADLRQVVTGECAGRTSADHVLLVELLTEGRQPGPPLEGLPVSTENEIKRFVVTSFAPDLTPDQLPSDLDLLDNGVVDSLGLLRLIAWVGERYGIPVEERDISPAQFSSVEAIGAFIRESRSFV